MSTKEQQQRCNADPVTLREDGDNHQIVGTAAVAYDGTERTEFILQSNEDRTVVERIAPEAIDEILKQQDDVRALVNHDPNQLLGRTSAGTLKLERTAEGDLGYTIDPPDTTVGRDTMTSLKRNDLQGSSFAFTIAEETFTKEREGKLGVITIDRFQKLYDVGPVTYPAYEGTDAGVRSHAGALARFESWETKHRDDEAAKGEEEEQKLADHHATLDAQAKVAGL